MILGVSVEELLDFLQTRIKSDVERGKEVSLVTAVAITSDSLLGKQKYIQQQTMLRLMCFLDGIKSSLRSPSHHLLKLFLTKTSH